ncbi:helix-turn-helix transcriptional regulator [Halomonas sp. 18071143]|uniref:helix-turn-helix transcriptional regulator n=1 Tax=Halomonas sp. 18071143 TaxID=2855441 RepID=UPI001C492BC8|nr:AraC family transcriptional regulator [Halomonas sp. 18071143]
MFNAMSRAEIWLQDSLDQPLSIEDLARQLGYSASQVRRQFRQCFNMSPRAYREQRRLERAAVLLSLTQQNIAHIAAQCGYVNHSSFSRAFQRRYQLSPRHYRQALNDRHHLKPPLTSFTTTIKQGGPRQAVYMRIYKAAHAISGLGNRKRHTNHLPCLEAQLGGSTPAVALPDLLADKVLALDSTTKQYKLRTDIGLHIENQASTDSVALPVEYRRIDIPSQHYAVTLFDDFSELSDALTATLCQLHYHQSLYHVSGGAPHVLWRKGRLELKVPLQRLT